MKKHMRRLKWLAEGRNCQDELIPFTPNSFTIHPIGVRSHCSNIFVYWNSRRLVPSFSNHRFHNFIQRSPRLLHDGKSRIAEERRSIEAMILAFRRENLYWELVLSHLARDRQHSLQHPAFSKHPLNQNILSRLSQSTDPPSLSAMSLFPQLH
jgi:hypothetical protein